MAMFTRQDLIAAIPDASLLAHLDDAMDGDESTVLAAVQAEAEDWVKGYLQAAGIGIPSPVPARLKHAAVKYAEYCLWRRRGADERAKALFDQWIKPAGDWLERVARGEETLTPNSTPNTASEAIVEDARLHNEDGNLLV